MAIASMLALVLASLLLLVPCQEASHDIEQAIISEFQKDPRMPVVVEHPQEGVKSDGSTYCCLKNGYGCMQECETGVSYNCCLKNGYGCMWMCKDGKNYSCCLKNGYGCMQMCEDGIPHYCCKKNGYGCSEMCPEKVTL